MYYLFNMLNYFNFKDYKRCIHISYNILYLIQQKKTKFTDLLMPLQIKEPVHQQAWYWPNLLEYLLPSIIKVNSLWTDDAIYMIKQHRAGSTLAQVMAWCPIALSHYLNQCWLIIPYMSLKIIKLKSQPNLPGTKELILFQCLQGVTSNPTAAS